MLCLSIGLVGTSGVPSISIKVCVMYGPHPLPPNPWAPGSAAPVVARGCWAGRLRLPPPPKFHVRDKFLPGESFYYIPIKP